MKSRLVLILVAALVTILALTNPNEDAFRSHVKEQQGLVGMLGLGLADLLSANSDRGIHRDNYLICSKFFVGGDGLLPRQDIAWGIAGRFIDIKAGKDR